MNFSLIRFLILMCLALAVEISRRHDGPPLRGRTFSEVLSHVEVTNYRSSTRTRILFACFVLVLSISVVESL
jgi:hypothetical protein